jgi:hypothetical protein
MQCSERSSLEEIAFIILSFFHELQQPCIENSLPLYTTGILVEKSRLQIIFNTISFLFTLEKPEEEHKKFKSSLTMAIALGRACFTKHMSCQKLLSP